jgi:addiction module RelB/DinJ family antitoxin
MIKTAQVRYRIPKQLVKEAASVCQEIGVSPSQAVTMFLSQMVRLRGFPFRPSEYPALDEYGVTLEEALATQKRAKADVEAARKAGKLVRFTGKLP